MILFHPTHDEAIVTACEVCRMFRRMLTVHPKEAERIIRDWRKHFAERHEGQAIYGHKN